MARPTLGLLATIMNASDVVRAVAHKHRVDGRTKFEELDERERAALDKWLDRLGAATDELRATELAPADDLAGLLGDDDSGGDLLGPDGQHGEDPERDE